jgi:hypothetical protein
MRTLWAGAVLAVVGVVALVAKANAVPSFTRQTGLTCNQCHVSHTPVPSFTFTGKKFRLNGYRMPVVLEKIEAGEEGKLGGRRLALTIIPMLSFRFGSSFLSQNKAPGAAEASPMQTRPQSNQAMFFTGAIGDYVGLWMETYFINATGRGAALYDVSPEEFDLKFVKLAEGSTFGLSIGTQSVREISGFGPWPIQLTDYMNYGTSGNWHPGVGQVTVHAFLRDRVILLAGVSPGADNPSWDRLNYVGGLSFAPLNRDDNELWINFNWTVGNDALPIATNVAAGTDGNVIYSDRVQGISALRGGSGAPAAYLSSNLGDLARFNIEAQYGFVDRGPHNLQTQVRYSWNRDTYTDNGEMVHNGLGVALQYFYDRTYGINLMLNKPLKYEFTSPMGVVYKVGPQDLNYSAYFTYRFAMNLAINLNLANTRRLVLQNVVPSVSNGWTWNLGADILF